MNTSRAAPIVNRGLQLQTGDIHVWRCDIDGDEGKVSQAVRLLSKDELWRAQRYRLRSGANRFILMRATLRSILATYCGVSASALQFNYGAHGKPYLHWPRPDLYFSVSHSGRLFACAISCGRELGIDVEHVCSDLNVEELAHKVLTAREEADLSFRVPAQARIRFFELWTRREACVKAQGKSLAAVLDKVEHSPCDDWQVVALDFGGDCVAALAIRSFAPCTVTYHDYSASAA